MSKTSQPAPAGLLYIPVRAGSPVALRLFRTPLGERTAVGFTSERRLCAVLGDDQGWVTLSTSALRALVSPLGVSALTVDPQFTAPAVSAAVARGRSARDRQAAGVLRVAGAAGLLALATMAGAIDRLPS